MLDHLNKLLKINGSKLLFGGEALQNHSIPRVYGAIKPTAVFIPLEEILKDENYDLVTKEIFGPFQVKTTIFRRCRICHQVYSSDAYLLSIHTTLSGGDRVQTESTSSGTERTRKNARTFDSSSRFE